MENNHRKKCHRYNSAGHAHELTFSCYRRREYFKDEVLCDFFLHELAKAKQELKYRLWAYIVMPHHVHLLVWPVEPAYNISVFLNFVKGRTSKRYREFLLMNRPQDLQEFQVVLRGIECFRLWQRGGGFDRNLWNSKAIHNSISYIEDNPVRSKHANRVEEWKWSSAYARKNSMGLLPDAFNIPVFMSNPQVPSLRFV